MEEVEGGGGESDMRRRGGGEGGGGVTRERGEDRWRGEEGVDEEKKSRGMK